MAFFIFYLRKEWGRWRTLCDFSADCVDPILTGWHPAFARDRRRPLADDLLILLVTPGKFISHGQMVDALASRSRWMYEREDTYRIILEQISLGPKPPARAEANELLNELRTAPQIKH